ncbi:MAG TPA: DUF885 domain-containing protein, partial [Mycobacteriales bacterium]|nr:DUF885 domain-containing protein [Mycobacteriales bacterium]
LGELPSCGFPADRVDYLTGQLTALECAGRCLDGEDVGYLDEVETYLQVRPQLGEPDEYHRIHRELDGLLPGSGRMASRYAGYRDADRCPRDRLPAVVAALSGALRERVLAEYGLPARERVEYRVVTGKPWSGFNYYLGNYQSRVAINADLPHRLVHLPQLVAHESYPGHHTENCRKHRYLVEGDDRIEHSLFLVNTPECLVAEGLADLGLWAAVGPGWGRWAERILGCLGIGFDGELAEQVADVVAGLDRVRQDAAIMLHGLGRDQDEVVAHLCRWLLISEGRARESLRFVADPLWRAYTSTYVEGRRLLGRWLDARPAGQSPALRFARLLDEPLTPARIAAEAAASTRIG